MKKHRVGVIIPYNKDRGFLAEAIQSVRNQVYDEKKIELFLIKINGPGCSVSANINVGLKIAKDLKCDFVKYFAEDDLLTSNCIQDSVDGILQSGCDFIHGNAVNFWMNSKKRDRYIPPLKTFDVKSLLKFLENRTNPVHGLTQFWKMEVFDAVGNFDTSLTCAEEHEFTLRALHAGFNIGYTGKDLGMYRHHDEQKSLGKGVNQAERKRIIKGIHSKYRKLCQG